MGGANYMCLCSMEFPFFSRKLAVASWSYSCFSKGRGRSESNSDFSFEPPRAPGHFEAVSEADGHGLKSCQVSRQSVFSISKSHLVSRFIWTLAFVPPLGLKFHDLSWKSNTPQILDQSVLMSSGTCTSRTLDFHGFLTLIMEWFQDSF